MRLGSDLSVGLGFVRLQPHRRVVTLGKPASINRLCRVRPTKKRARLPHCLPHPRKKLDRPLLNTSTSSTIESGYIPRSATRNPARSPKHTAKAPPTPPNN